MGKWVITRRQLICPNGQMNMSKTHVDSGLLIGPGISSALLESVFCVEVTQLLLVYLNSMLSDRTCLCLFAHRSVMSCFFGPILQVACRGCWFPHHSLVQGAVFISFKHMVMILWNLFTYFICKTHSLPSPPTSTSLNSRCVLHLCHRLISRCSQWLHKNGTEKFLVVKFEEITLCLSFLSCRMERVTILNLPELCWALTELMYTILALCPKWLINISYWFLYFYC